MLEELEIRKFVQQGPTVSTQVAAHLRTAVAPPVREVRPVDAVPDPMRLTDAVLNKLQQQPPCAVRRGDLGEHDARALLAQDPELIMPAPTVTPVASSMRM